MSAVTILLIALGVSADAFAVSLGKGLQMRTLRRGDAVVVAATFGGFQALMPLIGWAFGSTLRDSITTIDHWVAFVLLGAIGAKMIWEAFGTADEEEPGDQGLDVRELLVLGVATSIDALAVGVTLAFLEVSILAAVAAIGVTTFAVSLVGVVLGHRAGVRFRGPAEVVGGLVLVAIGTRVLLDHLGVW